MSLYHRFKDRFGTAGVVLGVIALILALGGSAIAASGLNGKQKKEVKAIAKSFQGTGPKGDAGAAGAPGTNGTNGKDGAPGAQGEPGAPGANGKSVTLSTLTAGQEGCAAGGTKVEVEATPASKKAVCNGKDGQSGFTETLPSGKTETGAWSISELANSYGVSATSISFSIPLSAGGESFFFSKLATEEEEFGASGCTGTVAQPSAPPGKLCIYTGSEELERASPIGWASKLDGIEPNTFGPTGALLVGFNLEGETGESFLSSAQAYGTWAVTAP